MNHASAWVYLIISFPCSVPKASSRGSKTRHASLSLCALSLGEAVIRSVYTFIS